MKRLWSGLLIVAALGCLLALWTLPASAYYPPLEATATLYSSNVPVQSNGNEVRLHVLDPQLQQGKDKSIQDPYGYGLMGLVQEHGVIAFLRMWSWNEYYVFCIVYDPGKADFVLDIQGPFEYVTMLTVKDGVVVYKATPLSPGQPNTMIATYDPLRGWMKDILSIHGIPDTNSYFLTKDGLVAMVEEPPGEVPESWIQCSIYDPSLGRFSEHEHVFIGILDASSLRIDNATLYFDELIGPPFLQVHIPWQIGYRPDYQNSFLSPWSNAAPSRPLAWFVAQPTNGFPPLWVWFTDMSIAGTKWYWYYGEGPPITLRSPFHVYDNGGDFYVSLSLNDGASYYPEHIYVGWLGMILRYPELVKQLALKKGSLIKDLQGVNNPQAALTILKSYYGEKPPPQVRSLYKVLEREIRKNPTPVPPPPGPG